MTSTKIYNHEIKKRSLIEPFNPPGEAPVGWSTGERDPVGKIIEILALSDPEEKRYLLQERSKKRHEEMIAYLDRKFPW